MVTKALERLEPQVAAEETAASNAQPGPEEKRGAKAPGQAGRESRTQEDGEGICQETCEKSGERSR